MINQWNIYDDRIKYVFDESEVYICVDGKFHSWGRPTLDYDWSFETVGSPIRKGKHFLISLWLESCLNEE